MTTVDSSGKNALHYCSENKAPGIVEMLLRKDDSILDQRDHEGVTPLALAVIVGNGTMVRRLLQLGADVQCRDDEGRSVAHLAAG